MLLIKKKKESDSTLSEKKMDNFNLKKKKRAKDKKM